MEKIKVCLAWHSFTSANYGVNALAIAHLQLLKRAAARAGVELDIYTIGTPAIKSGVGGLDTDLSVRRHYTVSAKIVFKQILKRGELYRELKTTNFMFDIGEGDSYTDIYGVKRLVNLMSTKVFSVLTKTKLVIAPQTIGPFKNNIAETAALYIIKRAEKVYTRDQPSLELLAQAGIKAVRIADVAFSLRFPRDEHSQFKRAAGINVSGLLWHGGYTGKNQFGLKLDYKELTKKMIDALIALDYSVHLISHVIDDDHLFEDDYRASIEIKKIYAKSTNVIIAPKFSGPIEAKAYTSKLDFFAGARMHATIGALSSGVPTLPIAYSRKFAGVFNSIGYTHLIDARAQSTSEALAIFDKVMKIDFNVLRQEAKQSAVLALESNEKYVNEIAEIFENEKSRAAH